MGALLAALPEKKRVFARAYAATGNVSTAAHTPGTGLSGAGARHTGRKWAQQGAVKAAIAALRKHTAAQVDRQLAATAQRTGSALDRAIARLDRVAAVLEAEQPTALEPALIAQAISAIRELCRISGWYAPEQVDHRIKIETERQLAAAFWQAARLEVGDEAARRIVARVVADQGRPAPALPAGEPEAQP